MRKRNLRKSRRHSAPKKYGAVVRYASWNEDVVWVIKQTEGSMLIRGGRKAACKKMRMEKLIMPNASNSSRN